MLQASMAETQRGAAQDQAQNALATAKMQADAAQKNRELQYKVAMNTENNLTSERIKTAELTVDEVRLRQEQEQTAIKLNEQTQRNLGR